MTIGHIYRSLSLGGMQRGAGAILGIHRAMGHDLVVFTRDPPDGMEYGMEAPFKRVVLGGGSYMKPTDAERLESFREGLRANPCDIVIHHEYYAKSLADDLRLLSELDVPTLVQWHSCFSALYMSMWWGGGVSSQLDSIRRYARGVLALSRTDRTFFELLGVPAMHVPYSDPDIFGGAPARTPGKGREILWPSRFSQGKRPIHALRVMEALLGRIADAHLTLLGDGPLRPDVEEYIATHPALAGKVSLPGFVGDVVPFFRKADVVLMTTEFEGFCHSIMEAKMAALPVVGYEMDYLDTTRPGTGYVSVPQDDVAAAAARVCDLLEDGSERLRLGALARADFERFAAIDQHALYREAFRMALGGREDGDVKVSEPSLVPNVVKVLLKHVDAHWRDCEEVRLARMRKNRAGRGGLSWLMRFWEGGNR